MKKTETLSGRNSPYQCGALAPEAPFRFLCGMKSGFLMSSLKVQRNTSFPSALNRCLETREPLSVVQVAVFQWYKKPGDKP